MERYYRILGLSSNATKEEIKSAYRTKIKALHPDKIHGTALEDTANFFTIEINEAYDYLMSQFEGGNGSTTNQSTCFEEDIFIESLGQLRYSLSNDFNQILVAIKKGSGVDNINTDGLEWTLNTGLSENVKKAMNKHNVDYSMTMYNEGDDLITIINRRSSDKWYFVYFNEKNKSFSKTSFAYFEEEILLDGRDQLYKYSLSNNLEYIRYAIYERTGYNINLENVVPKLNHQLSNKVKDLMNKYNVEYSMTSYTHGGNLRIAINRRVGDQWYFVSFAEVEGKLYNSEALREFEQQKKQAYKDYHRNIDNMYAEIEASRMKTDFTLDILGGIWNIIKDAGKIGY
jgi:hypothetical protein